MERRQHFLALRLLFQHCLRRPHMIRFKIRVVGRICRESANTSANMGGFGDGQPGKENTKLRIGT